MGQEIAELYLDVIMKLHPYVTLLGVSIIAAVARQLLEKDTRLSKWRVAATITGATLIGWLAGITMTGILPSEYIALSAAVSAACGREIIDAAISIIQKIPSRFDAK